MWATRRVSHTRDDQPVEYWFTVLFEAVLLPFLLWFAYNLSREEGSASALLLLFAVSMLLWLLRMIIIGVTGLGTTTIERSNRPFAFWSIFILQSVIAGGLVWLAFGYPLVKRPSGADKIYAVTAAVRKQMPNGRNAAFRNVRADAGSGFVCGELTLKDNQQRFFGVVVAQGVRATLDDQKHPGFDTSHARFCGGKWVLPPTR